jgi:hypothetical protein
MLVGKVKAALRLLTDSEKGGILPLSADLIGVLNAKHPPAEPAYSSALIPTPAANSNAILFAGLQAESIRTAAIRTQGTAGPSGGDADQWRLMCTAFGNASEDLCGAMANVTRRMATCVLDPLGLEALLANRLIPLDKNPGIRPIGVGETPRRIIAKAVIKHLREDIQSAAGSLQLCAGQESGCEAIIHAFQKFFEGDDSDVILLVDADNAFNRLNRSVSLWNIQRVCPPLAIYTINCYRRPSRLFVTGGAEIASCEGTTQGDPLAMPLYALSIVPFIRRLHGPCKQAWYADDAQAAGSLTDLKTWWSDIVSDGPSYGYFANPEKTKLVVKEHLFEEAKRIFQGTGICVTIGCRDLGAAIGSASFVSRYVDDKVSKLKAEMEKLSLIATSSPQVAHSAFVHGMRHKWTYLQRTLPNIADKFKSLEDVIRSKFIPALLGGQLINDDLRELMSLSARNGGLAIENPTQLAGDHFTASFRSSESLVRNIVQQEPQLNVNMARQREIRSENKTRRLIQEKSKLSQLKDRMSPEQIRSLAACQEKGASSLLTTLPLRQYGFALSRSEFTDTLLMRYRLPLSDLPNTCVCGQAFSVDHAQICHLGGFINQRHDGLRNLLADNMREVLHDVETEPRLQPLTQQDAFESPSAILDRDARADIRARGFWSEQMDAFFDVRVYYPNASSYLTRELRNLHGSFENQKKRQYGERIRHVDHGSFTPLVFTTFGGMGEEAHRTVKKLATMLAEKRKENYCHIVGHLRARLSFALCRAATICLRGTRKRRHGAEAFLKTPSDVTNFLCFI